MTLFQVPNSIYHCLLTEYILGPIDRAVDYLVKSFEQNGRWIDENSVGTGHRGAPVHAVPSICKHFPTHRLRKADTVQKFSCSWQWPEGSRVIDSASLMIYFVSSYCSPYKQYR